MVVAVRESPYIAHMLIEVHTREKPAVARRALACSIFLLVLATTLAAVMTWRRSGEPLMPRIEPNGWSISFRPPRSVEEGRFVLSEMGPAFVFYVRTQTGVRATLAVYRLLGAAVGDPQAVCDRVLHAQMPMPLHARGLLPLTWFDKKLGPHDAVEVWDPQIGVVVRAVVLGNDHAYAVSLGLGGQPIKPDGYHWFESICDSIE